VAIRDSQGGDMQLAVTIDAGDKKVMHATTPQLKPGVYTIRWQSLSADDDDFAQGSYKLTVLNADGSKPSGGDDSTGTTLLIIGGVIAIAVAGAGIWLLRFRERPA
jgi:hypothetical protein